jgi:hypothetical protein
MNHTDFVRMLGAIREHLTAFNLPGDIASIQVGTSSIDGDRVVVLLSHHQLSTLAGALLGWADTVSNVTVKAWRVPDGGNVHLILTGRLGDDLPIEVYSGVPYHPEIFGVDLQPHGRQGVSLGVLRDWASGVAA